MTFGKEKHMDVPRYKFTTRRSDWVFAADSPQPHWSETSGNVATREEMAIKRSRLDAYRELAEQEKPLELYTS